MSAMEALTVVGLQAMTPISQIGSAMTTAALAALASFTLSMLLTPIYTSLAYKFKLWKRVRDTAVTGEKAEVFHKLHAEKHKRNIPTMAGLIMVISIVLITVGFNLSREQTYLPLFGILGAGAVGLLDDFINIRTTKLGVSGLRSQIKFLLIFIVAAVCAFYFYYKLDYQSIAVPFFGQLPIGIMLIPLFTFVVVATANAVNISDGLDGLSGGLLSIAFGTYAVIALLQGNYGLAIFCATAGGTLLAYTWFNIFPARFFMGDIGSFALGTALGIVAMLTDTMLLLPIIGGIFVLEAGSSLVQILSKKILKRKLLLSAPIHHHFEAKGWPETKVTMRFWVLGAVCGVSGVILAIIGGQI